MIAIANAPVSYGVFNLTTDGIELPTGEALAYLIATAGYQGLDLGAPGVLGYGEQLTRLLQKYNLGLAGGWIDLPFGAGTDDQFEAAIAAAQEMMPLFIAGAEASSYPSPKPTLADSGDAMRQANPGGSPEIEMTPSQWQRFAERVERAATMIRSWNLEPTFHHHACTYIETPREIDTFLEVTDVGLTFDTGHLLIGGGRPLEDLTRWLPRINHVHLKDADLEVLRTSMGAENVMRTIWERHVFPPLGQGDLQIENIIQLIVESGYQGWIVVEQDVVLLHDEDIKKAQSDQIANREILKKWFK